MARVVLRVGRRQGVAATSQGSSLLDPVLPLAHTLLVPDLKSVAPEAVSVPPDSPTKESKDCPQTRARGTTLSAKGRTVKAVSESSAPA